jgi:hypothetical protein
VDLQVQVVQVVQAEQQEQADLVVQQDLQDQVDLQDQAVQVDLQGLVAYLLPRSATSGAPMMQFLQEKFMETQEI